MNNIKKKKNKWNKVIPRGSRLIVENNSVEEVYVTAIFEIGYETVTINIISHGEAREWNK